MRATRAMVYNPAFYTALLSQNGDYNHNGWEAL